MNLSHERGNIPGLRLNSRHVFVAVSLVARGHKKGTLSSMLHCSLVFTGVFFSTLLASADVESLNRIPSACCLHKTTRLWQEVSTHLAILDWACFTVMPNPCPTATTTKSIKGRGFGVP